MGLLTHAQARKLYLQGTGDSQAAAEEWETHLTQGLRTIHSRVDLPESGALDESVIVSANTDRVLVSHIDFDVYSISSISNSTDNTPMYPEPNGADGRRNYLTVGGFPPAGNVTHWVRDGVYLFVRMMPTVSTTLRIRGREGSPHVTAANMNETSPLPAQYDMPYVWASILSYMSIHDAPEGVDPAAWAAKKQGLKDDIADGFAVVSPRAEEDRTIRTTTRLSGYSLRPRSRRV